MSPLKFFEYMAMGKPILSSNVPDMNKIILENNLGILFENHNNSLVDIMNVLTLEHDFHSKEIYNIFKENYTWQKLAEKVKKVLEI